MLSDPNVLWPLLLIVACGSFLLGVRVEGYRWRRRCQDMLDSMEVMKRKEAERRACRCCKPKGK